MSGAQISQVAEAVSQDPNILRMGGNRPVDMSVASPLIAAMMRGPQPAQQMPQQMQSMRQPMQQPMQQGMPQGFPGMQQGMGYNPMMAIASMYRPPVQVQNPIFGGAIPMDFGLPQASRIPEGYTSRASQFRPGEVTAPAPAPAPASGADVMAALTGGYGAPGTVWGGGNQN
jgi:hypothetical protein